MKKIWRRELPTAEYLRSLFDYDRDTGILIWRLRPASHFPNSTCTNAQKAWNARNAGRRAGTASHGHINIAIDGVSYAAHRIAWKLMTGGEPPDELDHEDRDGTNNRWNNLRVATSQQNKWNSTTKRSNKLGIKGVRYRPDKGHYEAHMSEGGHYVYLGRYDTAEEAHLAYCAAAKKRDEKFWSDGVKA